MKIFTVNSDLLKHCTIFLFNKKTKSVFHATCLQDSSTMTFLYSKISETLLRLNAYPKIQSPWVLQNSSQNFLRAWEATFCVEAEMLVILSP